MRSIYLILYICMIAVVSTSFYQLSAVELPESEYMALFDLYVSTDGLSWNWQKPYATHGNPWAFDSWQGVTCAVDSGEYHVIELNLDYLRLRGFLPSTICNLTDIRVFSTPNNFLVGTIPNCIGTLTFLTELVLSLQQLPQLQTFYVDANALNGTLILLCEIQSLQVISAYNNLLTGTIPECIATLSQLNTLDIYRNSINGTIPSVLGNLSQLTHLSPSQLHLTGTIPSSFGNLSNLEYLFLETNELTGTLPSSLGRLSNLTEVEIGNNKMSGPLPSTFGDLQRLTTLSLGNNLLSGALPSVLYTIRSIEITEMSDNLFTGSISEAVGNLTFLGDFSLENNMLAGPFPASLFNLSNLVGVYLSYNGLTGTLPSVISEQPRVFNYFQANNNLLTGTIPNTIDYLSSIFQINLGNNHFQGTIPTSVGNIRTLTELDLSNNGLTGSIPVSFQNLTQLATLSLQGNQLNGPLSNIVRLSQIRLTTVQLDYNQFTGELPAVLFQLPSLISLSIVGSCLHGTLPGNTCNATQLEALILQGLTTGTACKTADTRAMSLDDKRQFGGSLPVCLFSMPRLHTLLLSSNGFTGQLHNKTVSVGSALSQLDLSHNLLSGSIPHSIQSHNWSILDLSHNKLNGVLHLPLQLSPLAATVENYTDITVQTSLYLNTNRLSGPVPNAVKQLQSNLSVLAGNLFQCRYDKTDLPQHDSDITTYECASNSFNLSIYVWLGLFITAMAVALVLLYLRHRFTTITILHTWNVNTTEPSSTMTSATQLFGVHDKLNTVAAYCTVFCMVVLLPYYIIVHQFYSTHTHTYAYIVSAIYTTGAVPFAITITLLLLLLMVVVVYFHREWSVFNIDTTEHNSWRQLSIVWFVFASTNITVVLGCNILFVYIVLYQSSDAQTVAQVVLSVLKLVWSVTVSPYMMRTLDAYYFPPGSEPAGAPRSNYFTLQLLVALFNNIAIPCLVVMAIDPNCFGDVLLPPGARTVYYLLPVCTRNGVLNPCQFQSVELTSLRFTPPFTYSYQCSASFITSYAPAFVHMSISNVFLHPLLQAVLLYVQNRTADASVLHKWASWSLPRILHPPTTEAYQKCVQEGRSLVTLSTQLGILLTFGAIFPPVALAMAVSIASIVYLTRLKVQRFVQAAVDAQLLGYLDVINAECAGVGTRAQMQLAVKIIVCYCCAFYTLFLFDTLGDTEGFKASAWVLIIVPLAPIVLFIPYQVFAYYCSETERKVATGTASVELTTVSQEVNETLSAMHHHSV